MASTSPFTTVNILLFFNYQVLVQKTQGTCNGAYYTAAIFSIKSIFPFFFKDIKILVITKTFSFIPLFFFFFSKSSKYCLSVEHHFHIWQVSAVVTLVKYKCGLKYQPTQLQYYSMVKWWHHQKETFFQLLALCAGNSLVTSEFPSQRLVMQSFDIFFDLRLNKQLSK